MKLYITFSGAFYDGTTEHIVTNAPRFGADKVVVYDDLWLTQQPFYQLNRWLWDHPHKRGFGWYCWKPFIIWDALSHSRDGDIVLYTDADTYPISDFSVLYERCHLDGGIMLFDAYGFGHADWCKRDCFIVMAQDQPRYRDATISAVARFMVFERGSWQATQFLMEWLTYCVNPLANTFDASVLAPEHVGVNEHRCEQSIMTNLAYKYGLRLYRCADQYGNGRSNDWDLYPQLFEQYDAPGATDHVTKPVEGSRFQNIDSLADRIIHHA